MRIADRVKNDRSPHRNRERFETPHVERNTFNTAKSLVHMRLVETMDLSAIAEMPREALANSIRHTLLEILEQERLPLNRSERNRLIVDIMDEILGFGPIESLIEDPDVQDILVNGHGSVFVERSGVLHETEVRFRNNDHLRQIIDKIVSRVGRRVDESSPMVDARLPDGSRVNVIIPPAALDGPMLSIRKFGKDPIVKEDLLRMCSITPEIMTYLQGAVYTKLNILISGGTGAGKTTLLNVLSGFVSERERIVTIEDSSELQLRQPHVVRLESRPPNIESQGEVTLTDLVKNSLRMRPDRIIVGETRGAEVLDMLQAMNTGHPGSMSTIHANSPRDALARIEVMIGMARSILSERGARALIGSAINIIVQLVRLPDGSRRVVSLSEVAGIQEGEILLQDIFTLEQEGVNSQGRIYGWMKPTGRESLFASHMERHGFLLPSGVFTEQHRIS